MKQENKQYKNFYEILNKLDFCNKKELQIIKEYINEKLK